MFCPKCGNEIAEGSAFCGNCGAPAGVQTVGATPAEVGVSMLKRGGAKIGIIVAVAAVVVVLVAGLATDWFGLTGVQPKETVEAYTWDELSQISDKIGATGDRGGAIEIAKRYNLCTPEGKLDGTQMKSVALADGTRTTVQIVGFAHDDKTSGGKAGITFIFGGCVADMPMNEESTSAGGWEASRMRAYLNGEWRAQLPGDLSAAIVPVDKFTNNAGETQDISSVTVTSDSLWLFSFAELAGPFLSEELGAADYEWAFDILNAEGARYQLFDDTGVVLEDDNLILVKNLDGSPKGWWGRTPQPTTSADFLQVYSDGGPYGLAGASSSHGVVPGFCI